MKIFIIKNKILSLLSFIFVIGVWKISSYIVNSEFFLPSPEITFISLLSIIKSKNFFLCVISTIKRGLTGFFISFIVGIVLGFLSGFNKFISKMLEPFIIIIRSTPVVSFILIALMQFKIDNVPIFISFLIAFPIIYSNVIEGIKNVDTKIVEMAQIYKVKKYRIITSIYIPSIISYLMASISTALGIGWKAIIAAEVLSQPQYSIGNRLHTSKINLDIEEVFAWTFVAILLSFIFEKFIKFLEKRIIKWR